MGVSVWFKVYCHKSLKTYESYGIVAQELNAESSRPTETKILPVQTSPLILYFIQLLSHGSKTKMLSGKTAASHHYKRSGFSGHRFGCEGSLKSVQISSLKMSSILFETSKL